VVHSEGMPLYCTISVYPAERCRYVQAMTLSGQGCRHPHDTGPACTAGAAASTNTCATRHDDIARSPRRSAPPNRRGRSNSLRV